MFPLADTRAFPALATTLAMAMDAAMTATEMAAMDATMAAMDAAMLVIKHQNNKAVAQNPTQIFHSFFVRLMYSYSHYHYTILKIYFCKRLTLRVDVLNKNQIN